MLTKLRLLRVQSRLTLENLAQKTGVTRSYLSKLERGISTPSIGTALDLARALNVPVEHLFGESSAEESITIVRASDANAPRIPNVSATARVVAGTATGKRMLAFVIYPLSEKVKGNPSSHHEGEELLYVLTGKVRLQLANRHENLEAGDCVHFDASIPHRLVSRSGRAATVLVVISPPASQKAGRSGQ